MTTMAIDHVELEGGDERVRCGPASFSFGLDLQVAFENGGRLGTAMPYDLASIPFNTAALLLDGNDQPTQFLVCNRWGKVLVRYGPIPRGERYPTLRRVRGARSVALAYDPLYRSRQSAFHPNRDMPFHVTVRKASVDIDLYRDGLKAFHTEVPLKRLNGSWCVPTDTHGHPLPMRFRRPMLARLAGVTQIHVEWLG